MQNKRMFKRIIPRIGQGCCVEQRMSLGGESIRILYDCGSDQINLLKGFIDSMDPKIPTILVVSHLHEDHINGIPYLIKKKMSIVKVILPEMVKHKEIRQMFAAKIILTRKTGRYTDDEFRRIIYFIDNPEGFMRNRCVIYIKKGRSPNIQNIPRSFNIHDEKEIFDEEMYHFQSDKYEHASTDPLWVMKFWIDGDIYQQLKDVHLPEDLSDMIRSIITDQKEIKKYRLPIKKY
jgi:metal-dependent hydrolase (beta-lactamase superfamily II)